MASGINSKISIREMIFMYSEAAKKSEAEYLRIWRMAFRGYTMMLLNNFAPEIEIELPVNANRTVTLPSNFIQYISVGEKKYDGKVQPFVLNDRMTAKTTGHGTVSERDYKIDRENNAIMLSPVSTVKTIVLKYIGSPEPNSDYSIPIQFQEAMIDWLSYQDVKHMPATSRFGRGDKMDRAAAFRASYAQAKKMYKPFRIDDIGEKIYPYVKPYPTY